MSVKHVASILFKNIKYSLIMYMDMKKKHISRKVKKLVQEISTGKDPCDANVSATLTI